MPPEPYPGWQAIASWKRASLRKLSMPYLPEGFSIDAVPQPPELRDCTDFVAEALDPKVNCLSEVLFELALQRARELDDHIQKTGKPVGPLHGLPISVKDQFRVEGAETSLGYVGWLGRVERIEDESLIVRHLKSLGAVIIAKTNVPTSLMAIETDNNIVGNTLNPHNRMLSCGGSSGGEAALLALRGSAIGLGSDLAASIRLPASINGICGLKPSHGRLPYLRVANSMEGQEINNSVVGPMARNVEDLQFLTQMLLSEKPWIDDPSVLPLPWKDDEADRVHRLASQRQLTFAIMRDDGIVIPHPPVARVLDAVASKLRSDGYDVIEWEPPHHAEAFSLLLDFLLVDGGAEIHAAAGLSGEPLIPQLSAYFGTTPGAVPEKSLHDTWEMVKRRKAYQAAYLAYWNSTAKLTKTKEPVDFVILPCSASPSFRRFGALYPGYTGVVNLLNFTSVAVPAGTADKDKDSKAERATFLGDLDKSVWAQYDPELFHKTPIGIQVMGRQLEEEKVLAVAFEVQRSLGRL